VKLDKKVIFKENTILQSLYKAATDQNIPPNTIIEFARIYGFQVDFQRDIRKDDKFQIMYEVFH
jgi:alanyl-tRNA synthetase